jgi:hypothetical protein
MVALPCTTVAHPAILLGGDLNQPQQEQSCHDETFSPCGLYDLSGRYIPSEARLPSLSIFLWD